MAARMMREGEELGPRSPYYSPDEMRVCKGCSGRIRFHAYDLKDFIVVHEPERPSWLRRLLSWRKPKAYTWSRLTRYLPCPRCGKHTIYEVRLL